MIGILPRPKPDTLKPSRRIEGLSDTVISTLIGATSK